MCMLLVAAAGFCTIRNCTCDIGHLFLFPFLQPVLLGDRSGQSVLAAIPPVLNTSTRRLCSALLSVVWVAAPVLRGRS
jgi:hypothetical protein